MSAGLHALSTDDIGTGRFGELCFTNGCHVCKPLDALAFHARDEAFRVEPHDGRYDRGTRLQHCITLCLEIGWRGVAGFPRDLRPPGAEKTPYRIFGSNI